MARSHARIFLSIWRDEQFTSLTSGAQRLYFVLLSQPTVSACGVTTFTLRRLARFACNTSEATVEKDLGELANERYVVVDDDTEELWLRTYMKHDGILESPNMIVSAASAFDGVLSGRIRRAVVEWFQKEYPQGFRAHLIEHHPNGFKKGLPEGFLQQLEQGLPEGLNEGIHACARAAVPSPSPSPSPSPGGSRPAPVEIVTKADQGKDPLFERYVQSMTLATAGKPEQHELLRMVLATARSVIDERYVDQIVGKCAERRPTSAHYLLSSCRDFAEQHIPGADLSVFDLPRDPTKPSYSHPVANTPRRSA